MSNEGSKFRNVALDESSKKILRDAIDREERGKRQICSKCGHINRRNSGYCVKCGYDLLKNKTCQECGLNNHQNSNFCIRCGHNLIKIK